MSNAGTSPETGGADRAIDLPVTGLPGADTSLVPGPAVPVVPPPAGVPAVPGGPGDGLAEPDPSDPSGSWALDLASATLAMDTGDTDQLFEALGGKLERILGARVQVQREGGLRRRHHIGRIVVDTGEGRLEAARSRTGPVFLLVHAVRGITLQTAEITADDWLGRLVAMVGREAARSQDVRAALGRLLET